VSLATGRYQLASALKTLHVRWDETCMSWRDDVRREFTERFWNTLEAQVPAALAAIDRLDQVLTQLRQDCA
jgi:hypothetical protein